MDVLCIQVTARALWTHHVNQQDKTPVYRYHSLKPNNQLKLNIIQRVYQCYCTDLRAGAKLLQSCLTLGDLMNCSLPGSSIHGILQARILEWVAMPSSRGSSRPEIKLLSLSSPALAGTTWEAFYSSSAQSLQSCQTLYNPMHCSPSGSSVHRILQARMLEWVTMSFSSAGKWKVKVKSLSGVRLSATPWTAAYQAPPSMGFSRQEYWSGVPSPSPSYYTRVPLTHLKKTFHFQNPLCGSTHDQNNKYVGETKQENNASLTQWRKVVQNEEISCLRTAGDSLHFWLYT